MRVLEAVAADPRRAAARRSTCWTPAERRQVLAEWNDTAAAVPAATVPELFEAQVARTPDAVAVACGDAVADATRSWMRGRAGWRGLLAGRGAGPESVVAVRAGARPRSWWWRCWRC